MIGMKNDRRSVDIHVQIYIDGARVKSKVVPRRDRVLCDGMRVDKETIKPFVFMPLELTGALHGLPCPRMPTNQNS